MIVIQNEVCGVENPGACAFAVSVLQSTNNSEKRPPTLSSTPLPFREGDYAGLDKRLIVHYL